MRRFSDAAIAGKLFETSIDRTRDGESVEVQVSTWRSPHTTTVGDLRFRTEQAEAVARIARERAQKRLKSFHVTGVTGRRRWSDAAARRAKRILADSFRAVAVANELRIKLNRAMGVEMPKQEAA